MQILVIAASRHGGTHEIAQAIASTLVQNGVDAEARPIDEAGELSGYAGVVLGSGVYMGRWLTPARQFAQRNAAALAAVPTWLFSSGPVGPPDHLIAAEDPRDIAVVTRLTGARGHRMFAGRLERQALGFIERAAVNAVHAPEGDYRDWDAIQAFAAEIANELRAASTPEALLRA
jgi:menaquinone-dependent protoporphyrinogen oxidase